jgi:formylglycine-generating enzyme required for sulfatase activity
MITIPSGPAIVGSTDSERSQAYRDYQTTAGHDAALRGRWFDREETRHEIELAAFVIDRDPVTVAAYAEFVATTGHRAPFISASDWQQQRFSQDYESQVRRFNWSGSEPPKARLQHPVVLVSWVDADAYCQWRGSITGKRRRLPSEHEFEKAARGNQGLIYPWGPSWDATKLNSAVVGPRDTVPVDEPPAGKSVYGLNNVAGNVFQWTSTPWSKDRKRMTVKGSAWDDYGGLGRGAARHGRRATIRHAIVGFRCAG